MIVSWSHKSDSSRLEFSSNYLAWIGTKLDVFFRSFMIKVILVSWSSFQNLIFDDLLTYLESTPISPNPLTILSLSSTIVSFLLMEIFID